MSHIIKHTYTQISEGIIIIGMEIEYKFYLLINHNCPSLFIFDTTTTCLLGNNSNNDRVI